MTATDTTRLLVVVLSLSACAGKDGERQSAPSARADAAPTMAPARPGQSVSPQARVTRLRRVKLATPARFSQRIDPVETDPEKLAAADTGAVETTDVLVVQLELDRPLAPGGAPEPVAFFNRVRPLPLHWSGRTLTVAVPDPGKELPSSVFWSILPHGEVIDAAAVHHHLAEIGRGEREPTARLGDGKTPVVPVEEASAPVKDLDALAFEIGREQRAGRKVP